MPRPKPKSSKPSSPFVASLPLATKRDIARHCRVSIRTVDNWLARKMIPCVKIGHVVRFDLDAVKRALKRFAIQEVS